MTTDTPDDQKRGLTRLVSAKARQDIPTGPIIDQRRLKAFVAESDALGAAQAESGRNIRALREKLSRLRSELNPGPAPMGPGTQSYRMSDEQKNAKGTEAKALEADIAAAEEAAETLRDRRSHAGHLARAAIDFAIANNQLPSELEYDYGRPSQVCT